MANLYCRTVFFVKDASLARRFYVEKLGFALDWDTKEGVLQVSLFGFELILNEVYEETTPRAGCGRLFIGLDEDQDEPFCRHIIEKKIPTTRRSWGRPTLVITDIDGNELFFWMAYDDFSKLDAHAMP